MRLKVVYENKAQYLEINDEALGQLTISLGINVDGVAEEEKAHLVQEAFDKQFNRPDYNNWHQHYRHWGNPDTRGDSDEKDFNNGLGINDGYDQFTEVEKRWAEDEAREKVMKALTPSQAEAVIAIYFEGMTVTEYAESRGVSRSAISQRLATAMRKLENIF